MLDSAAHIISVLYPLIGSYVSAMFAYRIDFLMLAQLHSLKFLPDNVLKIGFIMVEKHSFTMCTQLLWQELLNSPVLHREIPNGRNDEIVEKFWTI